MKREASHKKKNSLFGTVVIILLLGFVFSNAFATNGYFSHGYGLKYKALAGAGVALSLGPFAASTNPASMAFVGNRYDLNLSFFNPNRECNVVGAPSGFEGTFGLTPGTVASDSRIFTIPSLAGNWLLTENLSLGLTLTANGGMNTNYPTNTFYGSSPTGVDLAQMFLAPTIAIKVTDRHAFGITAILSYQRFEARGLEAFGNFSSNAANLSNNDHDDSFGAGLRVGYLGELFSFLSVGASYQTKVYMSEFDQYAGLFSESGDFDIPANWTVGIAVRPTQRLAFAFDVQRIYYSKVNSVGNSMLPNLMSTPLGTEKGAGFGWENMTVLKSGVQWQFANSWAARAGYSRGDHPVPESEVLFNILAPGVIEQHLTFGFTKVLPGNQEISFSIMHAFSNNVVGLNPLDPPAAQTIDLKMNQWEFGIGFSF